MAGGILVDQGQDLMLRAFLQEALVLKLYSNSHEPQHGDTEHDYVEATFRGYKAVTLSGDSWKFSGGSPVTAVQDKHPFVSNAHQSVERIHGYYLVQQGSGKLVAAEQFVNGPYTIANDLDEIDVTPTITQDAAG